MSAMAQPVPPAGVAEPPPGVSPPYGPPVPTWGSRFRRGLVRSGVVLVSGYAGLYLGERYARTPRESMVAMLAGVSLGVAFAESVTESLMRLSPARGEASVRPGTPGGGAILGGLLRPHRETIFPQGAADPREDAWLAKAEQLARVEEWDENTRGGARQPIGFGKGSRRTCEGLSDPAEKAACHAFFADVARVEAARSRTASMWIITAGSERRDRSQ